MKLFNFLGLSGRDRDRVHTLYMAAVAHARQPVFYTTLGVPDTVDGRFDMIALATFLILRRLKAGGPEAQRLSQQLFDLMFDDMDRNMREMGVGDLSVGRKVKELATLFYGRIAAYEEGLAGGAGDLEEALRRNLYRKTEPAEAVLGAMAEYLRAEAARSEDWAMDKLLAGQVAFVPPAAGQGGDESHAPQA